MRQQSQVSNRLLQQEKDLQQIKEQIARSQALEALHQDPVEWALRCRILKGAAFTFQDRDYLLPIYRDPHRRVVVAKARQMEMTEWIVNWLLYQLTTNPNTTAIYTAPRMDQVSRFSRDRLRKAIWDSPVLRHVVIESKDVEGQPAISRIPFDNGSLCYMYSGWGDFSAIRNIPADFAAVDEAQDVSSEALPVLTETMAHSSFGRMVIVGTSSDAGSQFDQRWQESDMKEWDSDAKAWVPQKPQNRSYSGYHMTQEMAVWITKLPPEDVNSIPYKRAHYLPRLFQNEVLGLFYRGLRKPLITQDLMECRDFESTMFQALNAPYVSYAGIDWGGGEFSFTLIWIMAMDELDRWRLLYVHKFDERDPMKQVATIGNLINLFNVKQAVADMGYGAVQVSELQKKFADRVLGCHYIRRPELPLEMKHRDEAGERIAQMILLADRSFWIETALDVIKRTGPDGKPTPRLVLPWQRPEEVEWLIDHFTCLEMEEQETVAGKKYHHYTHPEGQPDDAYHSFVYALIAYHARKMGHELGVVDLFG
jgi:hypothetical protein